MLSAQPSLIASIPRKRGHPRKDALPSSEMAKRRRTDVYEFGDDDEASLNEGSPPWQSIQEPRPNETIQMSSPGSALPRKQGRPRKNPITQSSAVAHGDMSVQLPDDEEDNLADGDTAHGPMQMPILNEDGGKGVHALITPQKRGRGRPRKNHIIPSNTAAQENRDVDPPDSEGGNLADRATSQELMQMSPLAKDGEILSPRRYEQTQELAQITLIQVAPIKRGRSRPQRNPLTPGSAEAVAPASEEVIPRKHGRPRKSSLIPDEEQGRSGVSLGAPGDTEEGAQSDDSMPRKSANSLPIDRAAEAQFSSVVPRKHGRPRQNSLTQTGTAVQRSIDGGAEDQALTDGSPHPESIRTMSLDAIEAAPSTIVTPRKRGRPRLNPLSPNEATVQRRLDFGLQGSGDDELSLMDTPAPHSVIPVPTLNGDLNVLKRVVLEKLTGKRKVQLVGMDDEYRKVYQLLEQTVVAGEGNSMLVIGARGSGKTTLIETIISEISIQHKGDFHTVRLNGFIHTDDRLALREIWRQLGREMEVDDDLTGKTNNYADTLSSLLALLSHPSDLSESAHNEAAKSVIFILNEFDLFASHPRQTLLYNLFDIAQGRKAPVAVLGLTTKIDVAESLEKRVKSRFSHRHVLLNLPKSLRAFWDVCKQALLVKEDDMKSSEERDALKFDLEDGLSQTWNGVVEELGNEPNFKRLLESIFYKTKGVKDFYAECLIPITTLSPQNLQLTSHGLLKSSLSAPESKLHILEGLSDLELSLLIAAARLDIILDTETCNFNMAYDEYTALASRFRLQSSVSGAAAVGAGSKIWGREVAMGAWERLAEYGLIVPAIGATGLGTAAGGATGAGGGTGTRDVGRTGRMFRVDVGLEEIWQSVSGLGAVMTKWCKEI